MRKIIALIVSLLWLSSGVFAQKMTLKNFNYSGANWQKYDGHRLTIVVLDTSIGGTALLAEETIKGGQFSIKGQVWAPQNAYFGLYNPEGDFVYKQEFIAEPGELQIDRDPESNGINIKGGKYNKLFEAIKKDPVYVAKLEAFESYSRSLTSEDFQVDANRAKYAELQKEAGQILQAKYDAIRDNNSDPIARLLTFKMVRSLDTREKELDLLQKELGELPEIVYLKYRIQDANARAKKQVVMEVDSTISDFKGNDLAGNQMHLVEVLKKNKYTLVEFWASWCGPCRAEIPHMKKAYERFNTKGFEILSFTLDHERERWLKASNEEHIPWINIGDLKAFKSPVVQMFGIRGIPANYLVDASGKIVAVNLRQEDLDKKLAELL